MTQAGDKTTRLAQKNLDKNILYYRSHAIIQKVC